MATPITHLFFADKFCEKHKNVDRLAFFAWNCLPDIRYIDKYIPRERFHIKDISLKDIKEEKSAFWKWVKFHSFVDVRRDLYYASNDIYYPSISDGIFIYALKVLEDDILYKECLFWTEFVSFFNEYEFPVENINSNTIKKRKKIIWDYLSQPPNWKSRKDFILWVGLSDEIYWKIESMLENIKEKHINDIRNMVSYMENIIV